MNNTENENCPFQSKTKEITEILTGLSYNEAIEILGYVKRNIESELILTVKP